MAYRNEVGGKTILLVEDDESIGELVRLVLRMTTPHRVLYAPDALQALAIVEHQIPDLLILDYQLPYMNGLELYDHLRTRKALSSVPALLVSANLPREALQERQLSSLDKPFEVEELVQTIEELLQSAGSSH
jgi:CheY-like chemotaxis protein